MRTNSNRRDLGSGKDDAMAALGAALAQISGSLSESSERDRRTKRQADADAETKRQHDLLNEDRDLARKDRQATLERAGRDDASQQLDQFRGDIGGGGVDLDVNQVGNAIGLATRAGRPGALAPVAKPPMMAPMGHAAAAMGDPISSAIMGLPSMAMQFRRNPAEQTAYDAGRAKQTQDAAVTDLLPTLPAPARRSVEFARAAGRPIPVPPASAMVTDDETAAADTAKRDANFADYQRRERFSDGVIRGRQADAEGRGPGRIKGDNPKMPRGVLNYVGTLTSKFGDNRMAAAKELRSAIPALQRDHPDLDLAALQQQFNAAFPKPTDDESGGLVPASTPLARAATPATAPPGMTPGAPAAAVPAKPPAGADPIQVKSAKQALAAAIKAGDPVQVAALRQQLATLTGR